MLRCLFSLPSIEMSLPPNYNPNDSLLSGGDSAKLIPVQGGGSMPDGTYNPDASLLSGGDNAKLIPVQGGGDPPSTTAKGLPSLNDFENLNVYVSFDNNEVPSPEAASEIVAEEKAKKESEAKPLEVPCPALDDEEIEESRELFEASDDAVDSKAKEVVRLVSKEFYIRVPKQKSAGSKDDDEIVSDWKQGIFTEDESDLLNTMGLSPKLLYSSFYCHDKDWKEELADFLYYLSVFTCYPASSLLLRGECQRVREFLMIVESNLKAEQLRKLAEKPVPVAGPISLPELQEQDENEENEEDEKETKESPLLSISERLKNIKADDIAKETKRKTVAARIVNFFKKFSKEKPSDKSAEEAVLGALEQFDYEDEGDEEEGDEEEGDEGDEEEEEEGKAKKYQPPNKTVARKSSTGNDAEEKKRKAEQYEADYQAYKAQMIKNNPDRKDYNDDLFREDYAEFLKELEKK